MKAALHISAEAADKVHAVMHAMQSDDSNSFLSFFQRAAEAVGIVGDIGSHAPFIGVVFATLKAVGQRVSQVEGTRSAFNQLCSAAATTAELLQMAESCNSTASSRSCPYPPAVQRALDGFWNAICELAQLLYEVRGKGYVRRLLGDSGYAAQLKSIRERLQQAKSDLQLVTTLTTLPIVEQNLTVAESGLAIARTTADGVAVLLSRVGPATPLPSSFKLPSQYLYVHRQALWQRLSELWTTTPLPLQATDSPSSPKAPCPPPAQPYIVVLSGLGGIGKSQLALRYALATAPTIQSPSASPPSLPTYSLRAWFDASSADQLQAAFLAFATTCLHLPGIDRTTPPDSVRAAVGQWLDGQPSWLLVFDNVEGYDDVAPYLPPQPSASASLSSPSSSSSSCSSLHTARHVLITSRHQHWPPPPLVQQLQVDEQLTDAESVELLVRLMHKRKQPPLDDCRRDAAYLSLAAQLQHYPLAISQAGAFLSQRQDVQLSAYAAQCESNLLRQKVLPTGDIRKDRNRDTVAFTFLTSIQAVEDDATEQGVQPVGHALLTACSYLHADAIPFDLLSRWLRHEYVQSVAATPDLLQATLSLLEAYSLLQLDVQQQTVRVHRVLQLAARHQHGAQQPIDNSGEVAGQLRITGPPRQPEPAGLSRLSVSWYLRLMAVTWVAYQQQEEMNRRHYLPHVDELKHGYDKHLDKLLHKAGKPYADEAVYALLAIGTGRILWPPPLAASTAEPAQRRLPSALLQCLAEYEKLPHLHTQAVFHALFFFLATTKESEGDWEEALSFIHRAHRLRERAVPAGSVSVYDYAQCLHAQQMVLYDLGRHNEEVKVCEQLLALSKQHFAGDEYMPDLIGVAWCTRLLAGAYSWTHKIAEWEELMRSALQLYEDYCSRRARADVPARVRQRMINIRAEMGMQSVDVDDHLALLEQLISVKQLYGEESVQYAAAWQSIAHYHKQAGDYQPAVDAAVEVLRIQTALFGPQHRELIAWHHWLGDVHQQWEQHQLALAAYERALDISREHAAFDRLQVAGLHRSMAFCYWKMGQGSHAARWYSQALAVYEVALPNSRTVAVQRWNVYRALHMAGEEPARQLELLRGALAIRTQLGDEGEDVERVKARLRELEEAQR